MMQFEFANPKLLYLLVVIIPLIVWYVLRQKDQNASLQISATSRFSDLPLSYKVILRHVLFGLKILVFMLLIVAFARPQSTDQWQNENTLGIDIVLVLDISTSMLARDFTPDRLEASKDMAVEFISGRPNDRIGLVIFAGESFTQCPLTTDHPVLINLFNDVKSGMIEDGTAIGIGLANAVKRLKDNDAISKVVILLTDGVNNQGAIDPITAAELAKTFGIRVYTVGVGTMGEAPYPVQDFFGRTVLQRMPVEIDEETLQQIADITNGQYFRATNNNKLKQIYNEIDQLEKTKISVKEYNRKQEEFMPFILAALLLLTIIIIIKNTILRSVP